MFCRIHIQIQVENIQNQAKRCKAESVMQKCAKEIHEEAHLHDLPRQSTAVGGGKAQPRAHKSKAVGSGDNQGAAAPWMDPYPHPPLGPTLLRRVACRHA